MIDFENVALGADELLIRVVTNRAIPAEVYLRLVSLHVERMKELDAFGPEAFVEFVEGGIGSQWFRLRVSRRTAIEAMAMAAFAMQLHGEYCNMQHALTEHLSDVMERYGAVAVQAIADGFRGEVTKKDMFVIQQREERQGDDDARFVTEGRVVSDDGFAFMHDAVDGSQYFPLAYPGLSRSALEELAKESHRCKAELSARDDGDFDVWGVIPLTAVEDQSVELKVSPRELRGDITSLLENAFDGRRISVLPQAVEGVRRWISRETEEDLTLRAESLRIGDMNFIHSLIRLQA